MHYCVNVIFMMKFCLNWGGAALLSMLLLCTSCGDADLFDTDKWTNEIEGWEPGVSLKVLQGSFTLWDLINQGDDDVVVKEGNDLIILLGIDQICGDFEFYKSKPSVSGRMSGKIWNSAIHTRYPVWYREFI